MVKTVSLCRIRMKLYLDSKIKEDGAHAVRENAIYGKALHTEMVSTILS